MLKKIKTIGSKMNWFSTLHEIEKYLLEIFDDKINALENKQRFYEKVLKKSDQLEGEEKIFFQIKYFWNWKNRKLKGVLWFTCYQKIIL